MIEFFRGKVTPRDWAFVGAIVAVIVLLVAAFVFFVHKNEQAQLAVLQSEIDKQSKELQEAEFNAKNIDELRALEKYTSALSEQLRQRLPDELEFPVFFQTLEGIIAKHELAIKFVPGKVKKDPYKETAPYSMTARGDFHKIVRFINDLECYERYVRVDDLDIKYVEAGVTEAKFVVSTFRYVEPEPEATQASERAKP